MNGNLNSIKSINNVIFFAKRYNNKRFKIVYCPPYTLIDTFSKKLKKTNIAIGAQNCFFKSNYGPSTGQINAKMLRDVGAKFVIIGHSENRSLGEDDKTINKKIHSALNEKLIIIFCIGETLDQRKKKFTKKILTKQIINGLKKVKKNSKIILAYEPVWSIGSGLVPDNNELTNNIKLIKSVINRNTRIKNIRVLYGGSVNSANIKDLNKVNDIDGYLIGNTSLNSKKFIDIVKKIYI